MSAGVRRAAGLVIFRRKDLSSQPEWLLLQTSYGAHHWTPPKGHLDPGEVSWTLTHKTVISIYFAKDDITAAVRETEEEAGLSRDQLNIFNDVRAELNYPAFGKPKSVVYWLAKLLNHEDTVRLSDEHQDFKWLSVSEAKELSGFEDMSRVFQDFHSEVISKNL